MARTRPRARVRRRPSLLSESTQYRNVQRWTDLAIAQRQRSSLLAHGQSHLGDPANQLPGASTPAATRPGRARRVGVYACRVLNAAAADLDRGPGRRVGCAHRHPCRQPNRQGAASDEGGDVARLRKAIASATSSRRAQPAHRRAMLDGFRIQQPIESFRVSHRARADVARCHPPLARPPRRDHSAGHRARHGHDAGTGRAARRALRNGRPVSPAMETKADDGFPLPFEHDARRRRAHEVGAAHVRRGCGVECHVLFRVGTACSKRCRRIVDQHVETPEALESDRGDQRGNPPAFVGQHRNAARWAGRSSPAA